jgi:sec-independent protein translocase protein TatA
MLNTHLCYAIGMPGGSELLIILLIVIVLFGANRLPQLGGALGKGIQNFRRSFKSDDDEVEAAEVLEDAAQVTQDKDNEGRQRIDPPH